MKDVFISYKAEELDEASWVKSTLEANGISCWMAPESITGGSTYAGEIAHAITGARVFLLILSKKAQTSPWIPREIDVAINARKTILPFVIENCDLNDDFKFYLSNIQQYRAYAGKVAAIKKLMNDIRIIMKREGAAPSEHTEIPTPVSLPKETVSPIKHRTKSPAKWDILSILSMVLGVLCFGLLIVAIEMRDNDSGMIFLVIFSIIPIALSILGVLRTRIKKLRGLVFAIIGYVTGAFFHIFPSCYLDEGLGIVSVIDVSVISIVFLIIMLVKFRKSKTEEI